MLKCLSFPIVAGVGQYELPSWLLRSAEPTRQALGRPLRRHGPAKAPAQQQNTKAPQLWPTNLLPRVLPACPACHRANPRLGPQVPTQRGVAQRVYVWGGTLLPIPTSTSFSSQSLKPQTPLSLARQAGIGPLWWVKGRAGDRGFRDFWCGRLFLCALRLCPCALSGMGRSGRPGLSGRHWASR